MEHVCIISLKCYDILTGALEPSHVGGNEVNHVMLARSLKRCGYRVSMIIHDRDENVQSNIDGITLHAAYRPEAGIPVMRFFWPRWFGLWSAMRRAGADIYHQMGCGVETGQVALWCRLHRKKFVFATAADADCKLELPYLTQTRDRMLYRYGIKHAHAIVSQTRTQQRNLIKNFSAQSHLIQSCTADPLLHRVEAVGNKTNILWVGRFVPVKRLEWLYDVVEAMPKYDFVVAGWGDERLEYSRLLIRRGMRLPNLSLLGRVRPDAMGSVYSRSKLLVCTSSHEGFPTTFIEAWANGVPIVTTFDPDNIIDENRLGKVVASVDDARRVIESIMNDQGQFEDYSSNARRYYERNHSIEVMIAKYADVFARVASGLSL